jgi:RNA-binding protein
MRIQKQDASIAEMRNIMTSKQRAYLKGLAMTMDPLFQIGKSSLTPEVTKAVEEALEARELIKVNVLKNCMDDPREIASMLSERTHSEVVQVIGKRIVLFRKAAENSKIELPQ